MKLLRSLRKPQAEVVLPRDFFAADIVQIPVGGSGKPDASSPLYEKWLQHQKETVGADA